MITSERDIKTLRQLRKQLADLQQKSNDMGQVIDDMLGTGAKLVLASSVKKKKPTHSERVNKFL